MSARKFFIILGFTSVLSAQQPKTPELPAKPEKSKKKPASVSTLETTDLANFANQPERVRRLIRAALALTKRNLTYLFGSQQRWPQLRGPEALRGERL